MEAAFRGPVREIMQPLQVEEQIAEGKKLEPLYM